MTHSFRAPPRIQSYVIFRCPVLPGFVASVGRSHFSIRAAGWSRSYPSSALLRKRAGACKQDRRRTKRGVPPRATEMIIPLAGGEDVARVAATLLGGPN